MRRIIIIALNLIVFATASPLQAEPYASLVNFTGKIEIYRNNAVIKPKKELLLEESDVITATAGIAVLFYYAGNYYGFFRGNSAHCTHALEYRILRESLASRLAKATDNLEEIFLQGTPVPGFQAEDRKKNINLLLILDVSTSMRGYFDDIKAFIAETIFNSSLINSDYLYFYTFGAYIRERIDQVLDLPGSQALVNSLLYSIAPDEDATDIGLALEALDRRLEKPFPYSESVVFFITDGKNDPHEYSPYAGVDIYASNAFKAFETIKRGHYKVMLLSIGEATAAKDLSGPLGGEYIEVSTDLTAGKLNSLLSDLLGDVEMIAPTNLGKLTSRTLKLKLAFLSSYISDKVIEISEMYYSIDQGAKTDLTGFADSVTVAANQQVLKTCRLNLPAELTRGRHILRLELVPANISLSGSLQDVVFTYAPFPWLTVILSAGILLLLAGGVFLFIRLRS